jgi:hypothetical protein
VNRFFLNNDSHVRRRQMCETVQVGSDRPWYASGMSKRNGDRARFQKDRKRKLRHRERIKALMAKLRVKAAETVLPAS